MDTGLSGGQQPLHLTQLGVSLLQLGSSAGEYVKAVVVTNGHLVREPTQIPCERGDLLGQLQPPLAQL